MKINIKKVMIFLALTFSVNWAMAALLAVSGIKLRSTVGLGTTILYMFVPMTMAIVVQKFVYKEPLKGPLGISFKINKWFLAAWLLPIFMAFAAFGVSLLVPGVSYSPDMAGMFDKYKNMLTPEQLQQMREQIASSQVPPILLSLPSALIAGITVNAVAGFGEELGWRGFLQKEFSSLGFWKSSLLIGVIWGIWHAPIILMGHNYPEHPVAGVFMMTLACTLLAPIFSYVSVKAKSVIAAAVAHGTFNASAGLAIVMIMGGNDLTVGMMGLAGIIALGIIDIIIFILDRSVSKEIGIECRL